ncbi:SDR family oxidoreductase [Paenibacillus albiflavus]|uniref:SDR family oxidoreductase n=1 Tax=Paenibacillus albiflavus TaxID=2545760 RepID=A0A4V6P6A0_9BACL|nr:SDR family oxidoreductase [Paenibacillus albiflavus]TCZ75422.1 SDR family oxidoreductase [Paenibacillus albiflavus]
MSTISTKSVVIITGASSGFGLLTALEFAKQGYQVIATMRNLDKKHDLIHQATQLGVADQIECLQLDVTIPVEATFLIANVIVKYGRIDVLVNNAGTAYGGYIEEIPREDWDKQLDTNFFGLVTVTQAVLPHMRTRQQGKIINISSVSGRFGFPGIAPYAASKFAVEGFSESLRLEMLPFGIYTVLIEPASYHTDIWNKGFDHIATRVNKESPYRDHLEDILRFSKQSASNAGDPHNVASLIVRVAGLKAPRLRYMVGRGSTLSLLAKTLLPWKWYERIIVRQLRK